MNSLSQNTSLLNTDPSHELAFFLSLLDAPFAPFMSSLDYASMMTNASSWFYSFLRKAFVSAIEKADLLFRTSPGRIQRFYVKQTRSRSIITIFGEITFKRTEYQRRDTKEPYCYIDRKLSLLPRQRYDCCIEAKAKEIYADHNSMIKTGRILGEQIYGFFSLDPDRKFRHLSRQTVYNLLHRCGRIRLRPSPMPHTPDTLYIMADEKWIPLQGECTEDTPHVREMVKVAVCFEGRERILKKDGTPTDRFRLKNKYIYSSCSSEKNNFWENLQDHLAARYDLNKVKKIYIMGDGAGWIRRGISEMRMPGTTVKAALDRFHASQAIHRMTSDKVFREVLIRYLFELKREEFDTVAEIARSYLKEENARKRFDENLDYIHRHWHEVKVMVKEVKIGCAMEQAISHIIASHFTSVPKAYSRKNLPLYLNSRIHSQNGEDLIRLALTARDVSHEGKDADLRESYDFSFFDDQVRKETFTVHLRNRSNKKETYPF